jgi:hypothetical protein
LRWIFPAACGDINPMKNKTVATNINAIVVIFIVYVALVLFSRYDGEQRARVASLF